MTSLLFKVLLPGGMSNDESDRGARYSLPTRNDEQPTWIPGDWMPPVERVRKRRSGYYLTDAEGVVERPGPYLYIAEYRGEAREVSPYDKIWDCGREVYAREARLLRDCVGWNDRSQRLLAADFAERVNGGHVDLALAPWEALRLTARAAAEAACIALNNYSAMDAYRAYRAERAYQAQRLLEMIV